MVAKSVDRVIPALVKRMAATEPFQAQPHAPRGAVSRNGVHHVFRTRRPKAARRRQPRRDRRLVKTQKTDDDQPRHRSNSLSNWRVNSSSGASAAARRGLRTISSAGSMRSRRTRSCSRMRRRIRFRMTAFPTARGIVKPIRGPWGRGDVAADSGAGECRYRNATK